MTKKIKEEKEEKEEEEQEEQTEETTEEKKEETEKEETEEETTEEETEEEGKEEEEAKEEAAKKVLEYIEQKKAKEKKKALVHKVSMIDREHVMYKSKKGEEITMKESEINGLTEWFKAFLQYGKTKQPDDYYRVKEIRQKLEPLQTGVAAEGGNLVPTILYNYLVPILDDMAVIRPRSTVIDMTNMKAGTLDIAGLASKPYVTWNAEMAQKGTTSAEFNKISLTPYILAGIITVTEQLIIESPFNIIQLVGKLLAEAVIREEDRVFMSGTGAAQPTGIDTYTFPTIPAGGALVVNHLVSAFYRLPQPYRSKAYWIMHADTMATVANLMDTTNRPIFIDYLEKEGLPTIKGRPVLENNDFGNNKIFLIDLSAYFIGQKLPMKIDTSTETVIRGHSMWERNEIAVRIEEKLDAELTTTRAGVEISNVRT